MNSAARVRVLFEQVLAELCTNIILVDNSDKSYIIFSKVA